MITLKEGLGGYGLQPYDDETGKYVDVNITVGGREIKNLDEYARAILEANDLWDRFSALSDEKRKAYLDKKIRPSYERMLQSEIDYMNKKNGPFGKFYETDKDLADAMPAMFGKEWADTFLNTPRNGAYLAQTNGYRGVPIGAHILQTMRFGDTKFRPIDEDEFLEMSENAYNGGRFVGRWDEFAARTAENGTNIVIWRGMHYRRSTDQQRFDDIFRSYVDSPEEGESLNLSLLGSGCFDSVIYMSSQRSYSESYSNGGMLAHAIFKPGKDVKVAMERDLYKIQQRCQNAWNQRKGEIKQFLMDNYPNDSKEIYSSISSLINSGDDGFCCMLCGYDALACGQGNGNQFDILNPRNVYISSHFEEA